MTVSRQIVFVTELTDLEPSRSLFKLFRRTSKNIPIRSKLIEFTRPNVIAKKYYHKHTVHIFVFIIRRELSFSKLGGPR